MSYWSGGYGGWEPRKSAAERRADAARKIAEAARRGVAMSPVSVTGRKIAQTFWGKAWCDNLERYQDFAYRLDRGRSYLRSGSVIDLQIAAGKVTAQVSGSSLYKVAIEIDAVERAAWRAIQRDCAGGVGSRIDLLSGRLSEPVMARLCADRTGLFPQPSVIRFSCSCPDYASMCKHVAATMYGIGARLDHAPELLFTLRGAALDELLAAAVSELPPAVSAERVLASDGLAALFGIELAEPAPTAAAGRAKRTGAADRATLSVPRAELPASSAKRADSSAKLPASRAKRPASHAKLPASSPKPIAATAASGTARPASNAKPGASSAKPRASSAKLPAPKPERIRSTPKRPAPSTRVPTSSTKRPASAKRPAASGIHSAQQFAHAMQHLLDELSASTTRRTRGGQPAAARPRSPAKRLAARPPSKR